MANVLIVAYLIIVLALIAVILLQRSEGGALGIGGGGGGGLVTARGSANLLTRTTAILAVLFMGTAIGLTILNEIERGSDSILQRAAQGGGPAPTTVLDALTQMQGDDLAVPAEDGASEAPPADDGFDLPVPDAAPDADAFDLPVPGGEGAEAPEGN